MKNTFLLLAFATWSLFTFAQDIKPQKYNSKISTELAKPMVTHALESWQLTTLKGENKNEMTLEAVKYYDIKTNSTLKGIKITIQPELSTIQNVVAKNEREFTVYLDEVEYAEVMVALNLMVSNYTKIKAATQKGTMQYSTLGGVRIGYIYNETKDIAFITALIDGKEIVVEFSSPEKFLSDFRGWVDIASKDLYLPENAEKLKKAKKSTQEAKDVKVEDI